MEGQNLKARGREIFPLPAIRSSVVREAHLVRTLMPRVVCLPSRIPNRGRSDTLGRAF